jgi:replication factor A1
MFKEAVDKFEPLLKENSVYTISNAQIKLANSRFSSIKNDFSLVFDTHAQIKLVQDDCSI